MGIDVLLGDRVRLLDDHHDYHARGEAVAPVSTFVLVELLSRM